MSKTIAMTVVMLASLSIKAGEPAAVLEELEARGMGEVAPSEMEVARELLEAGDERLLGLQLDLLGAMDSAHEMEKAAAGREIEALEAENEARVEQAAYEFLVEQILATGVASYWSAK
ncbi:MAG: hypothetical protein JRG91_01010 [Deltaproteobacteria bacterium]|nr:hypothetical protein [Deltaproteobacteria bacterium]